MCGGDPGCSHDRDDNTGDTGHTGDDVLKVTCQDCKNLYVISQAIKYGRHWKCRQCHSSYRFCRDNDPAWHTYNAEEKRQATVANRSVSQRGVARQLVSTHNVANEQYQDSNTSLPHLTEHRCLALHMQSASPKHKVYHKSFKNFTSFRHKCHASSNRCLTSSNKRLLETSALLL